MTVSLPLVCVSVCVCVERLWYVWGVYMCVVCVWGGIQVCVRVYVYTCMCNRV